MAEPILSRSLTNPVGQTDRIRKAVGAVDASLASTETWLLAELKRVPVTTVQVNAARYDYQISVGELESIVRELAARLGLIPSDQVVQQTIAAYQEGIGTANANLAALTDSYTRDITQILVSEPYQRRVALMGARVFEGMQGFQGETGVKLARILRQAVQDSRPPLDVAADIEKEFGIARARAETIARTEITGALRRGRLDEAQDARDRLGLRIGLIWQSALRPTTRLWHATRHGKIYTIEQIREFYSVNGNAINCYCSQAEILLNEDGSPVTSRTVDRMKKQREKFLGQETS